MNLGCLTSGSGCRMKGKAIELGRVASLGHGRWMAPQRNGHGEYTDLSLQLVRMLKLSVNFEEA